MKVTVVMAVYNAVPYLPEAIESMLRQTFKDFEFLVIDDASTDQSLDILKAYQDPRLRILENEKNIGLTCSLNKGLKLAKGQYIARMDADDVSYPARLEKQVALMEAYPEVGLCGTWGKLLTDRKEELYRKFPTENDTLQFALLTYNPFIHPSVMIRRSLLKEHNLQYNTNFRYTQDHELWTKLALHSEVTNLPEVLIGYRIHQKQISTVLISDQDNYAKQIAKMQLKRFHIIASDQETKLHRDVLNKKDLSVDLSMASRIHQWLLQLNKANRIYAVLPPDQFFKHLEDRWAAVVLQTKEYHTKLAFIILKSPFCLLRAIGVKATLRFLKRFVQNFWAT